MIYDSTRARMWHAVIRAKHMLLNMLGKMKKVWINKNERLFRLSPPIKASKTVQNMYMDKLFSVIADGQWHTLAELSDKLKLDMDRLLKLITFLHEYGFLTFREDRVKITDEVRRLLDELAH